MSLFESDTTLPLYSLAVEEITPLGASLSPAGPPNTYQLGTAGADVLVGTADGDLLVGLAGNDRLTGGDGGDWLRGGEGNDLLFGGTSVDNLEGGAGNDRLDGGADADTAKYDFAAGAVTVSLEITGPQNTLGDGIDTLISIEGLWGSKFGDHLTGNAEDNTFEGVDGDDFIRANGGNDSLFGGHGRDSLQGNAGGDLLSGDDGADSLRGNEGDDVVFGGKDNDILSGGSGNDTLDGEEGKDVYVFDTGLNDKTNVDRVSTFTSGVDTLRLENAVFKALTATGPLATGLFRANLGGSAADANDHILYETDTGNLYYDADGNGAGTKILFAIVGNDTHPTLSASDFIVF